MEGRGGEDMKGRGGEEVKERGGDVVSRSIQSVTNIYARPAP